MQNVHTDLAAGELVRVRGRLWRVTRVQRHQDCEELHLSALSRLEAPRACALLFPFDRPRRLKRPARVRAVPARAAARALARAAFVAHPADGLQAAAAARMDLHAYQLEPALAVVNGLATRVLLADDVGLGKTVQAGLVLAELAARGLARRVLVLTPPGLRDQWASELERRFGLDAAVIDAAALAREVAQLPRGTNPWALDGIRVVSFDFIKRPEAARAVEGVVWDALVIDEAHAVSGRSDRRVAASGLARRSRVVVLLTATPHAGSDAAYETLRGLGRLPDAADDRVLVFRRARERAGMPVARRVKLLAVAPSDAERRMHRLLERYTQVVWREAAGTSGARLAMIVLRKRALSSAGSLASSIDRRRQMLDRPFDGTGWQPELPLDPDGETDDADQAPDTLLAARGLADCERERRWLAALAEAAAEAAGRERKLAALTRLVRRAREPVIVFTEYRDTLERVANAMAAVAPVTRLHGGLTRPERVEALARFESGRARVLVATDAAGEGLNLQGRCRWVIDFELPWTPSRLEQRVGRVDRIGQTRRVHALHLVARDTAEALVVSRLVIRAGRARRALGPEPRVPALPEAQMAALVMGRPSSEDPSSADDVLTRPPPSDPALTRAARAEVVRATTVRALARLAGFAADRDEGGPALRRAQEDPSGVEERERPRQAECREPGRSTNDAPVVCGCRRGRRRPARGGSVVLVYRAALVDADGRRIDARLLLLTLAAEADGRWDVPCDLRAGIERLLCARAAEIDRLLAESQRARLAALSAGRAGALVRPLARERALGTRSRAALARAIVQPGLFDGRAVARAAREQAEETGRLAESDARVRDLEAGLQIGAGSADLVAAFVFPAASRRAKGTA